MKADTKAGLAGVGGLVFLFLFCGVAGLGAWIFAILFLRLLQWIAWKSRKSVPPMPVVYPMAFVLTVLLGMLGDADGNGFTAAKLAFWSYNYGLAYGCWFLIDIYIQRLPLAELTKNGASYSLTVFARRRAGLL